MRVEIVETDTAGRRTHQTLNLPRPVSARLRVHHPDPQTAVLTATGELDDTQAPRLQEMLRSRMAAVLRSLIVDIHEVEFLSVGALETLLRASRQAETSGIDFQLVGQPPCVQRALAAAALTGPRPRVAEPRTPPDLPHTRVAAAGNFASERPRSP